MIKITIPSALRRYCGDQASVELAAATVGEALQLLVVSHPGLKSHLMDGSGKLRSFVNVFLGEEDVRNLNGEETSLKPGDELLIIPAIAGGSVSLSPQELARYDRHITLPEVGLEGQKKLKAAKVFLVGTGGLGSPLGLYLAAAGIGKIGLADYDVVDASNLQRQIIHGTKDVGRPKVQSARDRLLDVNPYLDVEIFETPLKAENAMELLKDYDIVIDGTDNFPTRYLVNDACVLLGKPNVYGSIFRFEGQVSLFYPGGGYPCYRCLYPEPPPPGMVPSCAEGGVLGVLPGVVGCLQATEAIKQILGIGTSLGGRLLLFNALDMKFRELKLRRDPACPLCGDHPTIKALIDYEEFCGLRPPAGAASAPKAAEITPAEFKAAWEKGDRPFLIDVREPHEWDIANLAPYGAKLIPLGTLPSRLDEVPKDADIVVQCKSGGRSGKAVQQLVSAGYTRVQNLTGGILRWATEVDPSLTKY